MIALGALLAWSAAATPTPAPTSAPKELTLAFTGDNRGEIKDCGCAHSPTGGLGRRKTALTALGSQVLVVDAGNALFRAPGLSDDAAKKRAALILSAMGESHLRAMAVGANDLVAGVDFLRAEAQKAHVPLLSANLRAHGKPLFEASKIEVVAGLRVALLAVSAPGPVDGAPGVEGIKPLEAVKTELARLKGKAELIVMLAAMPSNDVVDITRAVGPQIDFVIQSSEMRGRQPAQPIENTFLIGSGSRGQVIGTLRVGLNGAKPYVDLDQQSREEQSLQALEYKVTQLNTRLAAAKDPAGKQELQSTLTEMNARVAEQRKKATATSHGARGFKLDWLVLDASVKSDAEVEKRLVGVD